MGGARGIESCPTRVSGIEKKRGGPADRPLTDRPSTNRQPYRVALLFKRLRWGNIVQKTKACKGVGGCCQPKFLALIHSLKQFRELHRKLAPKIKTVQLFLASGV